MNFKAIAENIIFPVVAIKRYSDSKNEIKKTKNIEASLTERHLGNAQILPDRRALLKTLGENAFGAEVGVASGMFSDLILEISQPKILHLIDYWKKDRRGHGITPGRVVSLFQKKKQDWNVIQDKYQDKITEGKVVLHRGLSWDMLNDMPDSSLDWIYIDAAHDYSSVKKDLDAAKEKVKNNGVIMGHDYVRWGRHGFKCGVVEAVNEFCIVNDYEFIYLTNEVRYPPSYALRAINPT